MEKRYGRSVVLRPYCIEKTSGAAAPKAPSDEGAVSEAD